MSVMLDTLSFLCQSDISSVEVRLASSHALRTNIPIARSSYADLPTHAEALKKGQMLPIGSVEFVRKAMLAAGMVEPENLTYPEVLRVYLHRNVTLTRAGLVPDRSFIKPVQTKAFTGFLYDPEQDEAAYSEHDREQLQAFMDVPADFPVWISEPVQWLSEHRYYVLNGVVCGVGRYDDGPDDAPGPDPRVVEEMASTLTSLKDAPAAFGLDVGVLSSGETALVEVNDAWALGYYLGSMSHTNYLLMLGARWQQLQKCVHKRAPSQS